VGRAILFLILFLAPACLSLVLVWAFLISRTEFISHQGAPFFFPGVNRCMIVKKRLSIAQTFQETMLTNPSFSETNLKIQNLHLNQVIHYFGHSLG